jgi:hypothetical protein
LVVIGHDMGTRYTEGQLSPEEAPEYGRYFCYATFIAILQSKARQMLAVAR